LPIQPSFLSDGFSKVAYIVYSHHLVSTIIMAIGPQNGKLLNTFIILTVSFRAAQIGTLPLSILLFSPISGLFFVTNLAIIPY
jgi:hypothetical protein